MLVSAVLVVVAALLTACSDDATTDGTTTTSAVERSSSTTAAEESAPDESMPDESTEPVDVEPDCAAVAELAAGESEAITGRPVDGALAPVLCRDGWAVFVFQPGSAIAVVYGASDGRWENVYALDLPGAGVTEAEFREAMVSEGGVPAWVVDEVLSSGAPPPTTGTIMAAGSCDLAVLAAAASARDDAGSDPTETVDGSSYCDGRWAVVDISSDTYAFPVVLRATSGAWAIVPRGDCSGFPQEIQWVCQVS